jgi:hypothetical protein
MGDQIDCAVHGERQRAFVCSHLLGKAAGLGFNRDEPSKDSPFPDAWCDDCEIIRAGHGSWTDEAQNLVKISLICSACYEQARIRNTRTDVTLDDLADLRWKCHSCEEWHTGPCFDFSYDAPCYWRDTYEEALGGPDLPSSQQRGTFLNEDYCSINSSDLFVRGVIHLPIIGTLETFRWGVWGSLNRDNFETLLKMENDPKRIELPPMFSWLSSRIPEYPNTLNLKMYAHIQKLDWRPHFELEPTDHPLSREFHDGVSPERVKEIMTNRLRGLEQN